MGDRGVEWETHYGRRGHSLAVRAPWVSRGATHDSIDSHSPLRPCPRLALAQNMYLLLVTNKGSNILEDLETLRLLGKVREREQ